MISNSKLFMQLFTGLIITMISTYWLKNLFKVPIPSTFPLSGHLHSKIRWSFPSGHTSMATFVFGWIYKKYPSNWTKLLFLAGWFYFGFRSFLLGYHTLEDIIGGTLLGLFILRYF